MLYQVIEVLGTASFAISGVSVAMGKKLDGFGVLIIAFVTSVGGGTVRDVLIGQAPVTWMTNMTYVYVIFVSTVFTIFFKRIIGFLRTSLFLFDTIGIGLFTVVGVEKGIMAGLHPIICISLGTITACFGGVIRDILCNEIPVVFRKEIYATACIAGGLVYFILKMASVSDNLVFILSAAVVIVIRLVVVKFKISL
ncbi:MAG TPA: trimeric intracellular cation channel family protein, partial [Aquaticitalea sp.]|nr:trimeric intracellular cation channel family protein [Aquaticitalea sp.]